MKIILDKKYINNERLIKLEKIFNHTNMIRKIKIKKIILN
jgi:hypothetical protein